MHPNWIEFLRDRDANIEDNQVVSFGNVDAEARAATHGNIICDLSHYGQIRASGADVLDFLQGQLTNDVREVSATRSQLTAYCSPKGRVLSLMRLSQHPSGYRLKLPRERLPTILQRLRMYVLRAEVELEIDDTEHARIGLAGPGIADMLAALDIAAPTRIEEVHSHGELNVIRVNGGNQTRFEITGALQPLQQLWDSLSQATPIGINAWGLLDVNAGIPEIFTPTADLFVPQMINLHHLDAVSFTKGCYTGQEIVARSHYLGKVKRHLVRGRSSERRCPEPGTTLSGKRNGDSVEIGRVVSAYTDGEGCCRLLAVVQEVATNLELSWQDAQGTSTIRLDAPD